MYILIIQKTYRAQLGVYLQIALLTTTSQSNSHKAHRSANLIFFVPKLHILFMTNNAVIHFHCLLVYKTSKYHPQMIVLLSV